MSYNRNERSARGTFSYWLPLALTVTAATVGIAAWVWSERSDDEDKDQPTHAPGNTQSVYQNQNANASFHTGPPSYHGGDLRPGETGYGTVSQRQEESQGYIARMSGALQRAPSPQQVWEGASRSVVAGVAAAGAVVGTALSSIREEDKNAFKDHRTWEEEAEARRSGKDVAPTGASGPFDLPSANEEVVVSPTPKGSVPGRKRKTVAIVVSADTNGDMLEEDEYHEHASILSHLPRSVDLSQVRLFILIYAPGLKEHPLDAAAAGSLSSSFSVIGNEQAQTSGEGPENPLLSAAGATVHFNAVYAQALALVEKDTMVMPFATPTGHMHILRHLAPDIVYLQESLAGQEGDVITHLQTWLRQDVVVIVGANGGHGGLADSESEAEQTSMKQTHWWEKEERVGRGRGVAVVEGIRVGDDWARRVENRE